MSARSSTTSRTPNANQFIRHIEREDRERRLIAALRTVAHLASQLANDTPGFAERVRLNQITARADDELRTLCNQGRNPTTPKRSDL